MADSHHDFGVFSPHNENISIPSTNNTISPTILSVETNNNIVHHTPPNTPTEQSPRPSIDDTARPHATDQTPHLSSADTIVCQLPGEINPTNKIIVLLPSATVEQINSEVTAQIVTNTQNIPSAQPIKSPDKKTNVATNRNTLYANTDTATKKATLPTIKEEEKKSKKSRCQIL